MPFSKENEQKITKNYERIVNELSHIKLVDALISKEVLSIDDGERINSKATRLDKNEEFVRLLLKGPEKGFNEFIEELRNDSAYVELADQIEKTEVNIQESTVGRPSIHISPTNVEVVGGQSHTITCSVSSISVITDVTWIKRTAVGDEIVNVVGVDGKFSGGTLSDPSLTINNIAKSDEGTYMCRATNCFGTTSSEYSVLTCKDNPFPVHTSNQGRTNYARISIVVVDIFPNILREIMRSNIKPEVLNQQIITQLKNNPSVFNRMTREERVSLNTLTNSTYDNIDFITLYKLMRTFLLPDKPTQGWGKPPMNADVTISDDVERLRFVRNKIVHRIKADIDLTEMSNDFSNIVNITQRIDTYLCKLPDQGFTREVFNIQTCCMDSETEQKYYQALKDIEDIKEKFSEENVQFYYEKMFSDLIQDVKNKAKSSVIPISLVLEDINDDEKQMILNQLKTEINSGLVNIKFKQVGQNKVKSSDEQGKKDLEEILKGPEFKVLVDKYNISTSSSNTTPLKRRKLEIHVATKETDKRPERKQTPKSREIKERKKRSKDDEDSPIATPNQKHNNNKTKAELQKIAEDLAYTELNASSVLKTTSKVLQIDSYTAESTSKVIQNDANSTTKEPQQASVDPESAFKMLKLHKPIAVRERPASEIVGDSLRLISGNEQQEASRLQNVWVSDTSSSCNCPCFLRVKALEEQIKSHHSSFGELFNRLGQAENSLTWAWNYINNMTFNPKQSTEDRTVRKSETKVTGEVDNSEEEHIIEESPESQRRADKILYNGLLQSQLELKIKDAENYKKASVCLFRLMFTHDEIEGRSLTGAVAKSGIKRPAIEDQGKLDTLRNISEMTKLDQEFRLLLSQISDKLSTEDIRSLGFLLGHQIPVQDLENVKTGEDIFELMLKHGLLSKTNTDFLSKMLEDKNLSPCVELLQTFNTDNEEELKKQEEDPQSPMMGTSDEIKVDKELLSKGKFTSYDNCVYLGGACNVGKSTLASILIGEDIPQHWKSTDGLTIYFGRNGIDLKNKEMVPLKQDFGGDVLSKVLRGKPDMTQEKPDTTLSKNREEVLPHDSNKGNIIPETHTVTQRTDITLSTSTVPGTGKDDVITTIQEYVKEEIRKGTYKMEIAPSDLVDFGGQRSFDMTHQLFMRRKGTFVLMFNGRIDFLVPLKEYEQGETTESILKHWVNSILSYCGDDDVDILPIILFCATHSDDFKPEDRKDRKKKLIHDLGEIFKNHKRQHRIIYDDIFFINGQDKNDLEINKLKSKLVEVACKQKSWGKRMPMAYVPLDLQMSELRLHNMSIISKEELITLNKRNEDLALTDEQIKDFLNDQHSLGKIVYFDQHGLDNFINLQPQSLVNILRSFITAKCFWPEDKELKGILRALTDTGKIAKQDLLKLWSQKKFHQHMPNDDFKEFIIQVLVHLDILVEPRHYRQEKESKVQSYLVPCIVKRRLPVTNFSADKMICLSYTLLKSSIPTALSFKLIGAAINLWPLKETPEGICLYHQAAILSIDESNELHLSVEDDKVFVYFINKDTKSFITPNMASVVQECLTLTMTKVLEFYHKSFGNSTSELSKAFEIEVGEWCTSWEGCYISVPELKEQTEWRCKNNKTHQTKYPRYWIFDKKQVKCGEKCPGLDKGGLELHPGDKHFFRLANLITLDECDHVVTRLGLSEITWNDIKNTDRYDIPVKKGVALCKWRYQKEKNMSEPSFQELFDALAPEKKPHALCQLFMEDVTVYEIPNSALQEIPEDDVLQDLSKKVGNCAMHLGVELGLSMAAIEGILLEYPKSMYKQNFGVMKEWKSSSKVKATIRMLMKAFQWADGRGVAFFKEKYKGNSDK